MLTDLGPLAILGPPLMSSVLMLASRRVRSAGQTLAAVASLPALLVALISPGWEVDLPWLLLGTTFRLDETGRIMLALAGSLWLVGGLYARTYLAHDHERQGFYTYFPLTMLGNLGVAIAGDIASFYLCFALMTFAAYGLVVHDRSDRAFRAGRIYIVYAVLGEGLLLAALLLAGYAAGGVRLESVPAAVAASSQRDLIVGLVLGGFGVKAGLLGLHVWLPLAHPVAPTPASAVLSGVIIKAGVLGWLRFLPLGQAELSGWGIACVGLGLLAAFYGVAVGLTQCEIKVNLAYSSISQMGIMTAGLGVGLAVPSVGLATPVLLALYAVHHGLAKAGLFLASGIAPGVASQPRVAQLLLAGTALCALALAGAPFTSGAVAKGLVAYPALKLPDPWAAWVGMLMPLTAVGTTLLMARLLFLLRASMHLHGGKHDPKGLLLPWLTLVAGVAMAVLILPLSDTVTALAPARWSLPSVWSGVWPILLGMGLAALAARQSLRAPAIPPGDILELLVSTVSLVGLTLWVAASGLRAWTELIIVAGFHLMARRVWRGLGATRDAARSDGARQVGLAALTLLLVLLLLLMGGAR